ncbi:MAG: hypothetical protein UY65_C0004G0010 [Parcubacteria group bacterium GW2011_GWA2_51_12]|nr:MAG: hypothetical protein UY65_C0004G0010 [Parcubacteria group bacterium GW2011_GWA2_51_12]
MRFLLVAAAVHHGAAQNFRRAVRHGSIAESRRVYLGEPRARRVRHLILAHSAGERNIFHAWRQALCLVEIFVEVQDLHFSRAVAVERASFAAEFPGHDVAILNVLNTGFVGKIDGLGNGILDMPLESGLRADMVPSRDIHRHAKNVFYILRYSRDIFERPLENDLVH